MIVFVIIAVIFLVAFAPHIWQTSKPVLNKVRGKKALESPTAGLSVVAKKLYDEYMELPVESRPYSDIVPVLRGLDESTSHDVQGRNDHYDNHYHMRAAGYSSSTWQKMEFRWKPEHGPCEQKSGRECEFHIYRDLHDEIVQIKKELMRQARALNKSNNAHRIEDARELAQRLREERAIQADTTKMLES